MGVTKKATVVAKMATKKRGRPVGSRNIKTLEKMKVGDTLSFDELNRLNTAPAKVDWEKLAKRLQEALAAQIKEADSYKKLFEDMKANSKSVSLLTFWQRIKLVFTGSY
jgi:hypothetical protein